MSDVEKPVVTNATISTAIGSIIPAVMLFVSAFSDWSPNEEQTAALSALTIAIIGLANAFLSKNAAGKVYVPSTVQKIVVGVKEEMQADADERVRVAESFGRPDQNQMPMPVRPPGL